MTESQFQARAMELTIAAHRGRSAWITMDDEKIRYTGDDTYVYEAGGVSGFGTVGAAQTLWSEL